MAPELIIYIVGTLLLVGLFGLLWIRKPDQSGLDPALLEEAKADEVVAGIGHHQRVVQKDACDRAVGGLGVDERVATVPRNGWTTRSRDRGGIRA